MTLLESLTVALRNPSPAGLYALGATLRERAQTASETCTSCLALALDITADFYAFLSAVQAKMEAEQYNRLASMLDLGSVGTVALQNILAEHEGRLRRVLMGGLSESMMLLGSLQYIKAWEREIQALHEQAVWQLHEIFWKLSLASQPALPPTERRRAVESLLAPCLDGTLKPIQNTIYIGWLFQFALLSALTPLIGEAETPPK